MPKSPDWLIVATGSHAAPGEPPVSVRRLFLTSKQGQLGVTVDMIVPVLEVYIDFWVAFLRRRLS